MSFPRQMSAWSALIEVALERYLPDPEREPRSVHRCMRYSVEGGKRIRPILSLAVADSLGCPPERVLPTAAAVELIHSHSLILDDLPCMDDDDIRRGRPAAHRAFGEGVALLSADALLNLAILLLASNPRLAGVSPDLALELIREVGANVGTDGVIGGQSADLAFTPFPGDAGLLERIHLAKTARLFRLSARAGACIAGAEEEVVDGVGRFGEQLGLAFQIMDDLQDLDPALPGGRHPSEPSFATLLDPAATRRLAEAATSRALECIGFLGPRTWFLRELALSNLVRGE